MYFFCLPLLIEVFQLLYYWCLSSAYYGCLGTGLMLTGGALNFNIQVFQPLWASFLFQPHHPQNLQHESHRMLASQIVLQTLERKHPLILGIFWLVFRMFIQNLFGLAGEVGFLDNELELCYLLMSLRQQKTGRQHQEQRLLCKQLGIKDFIISEL